MYSTLTFGLLAYVGLGSALGLGTRDTVPVAKTQNGTYYGGTSANPFYLDLMYRLETSYKFLVKKDPYGPFYLPSKYNCLASEPCY